MSCKNDCTACPFNIGHPDCDDAYNLGCLPSVGEVIDLKISTGKNWACHSKTNQICAGLVGFVKENKLELDLKTGDLLIQEGVHFTTAPSKKETI